MRAADVAGVEQSTKKVTGTVVDPSGESVIGASILEKGTTNGTITDFDGNFRLDVKPGATLVISYIGYKTQEVKVGNLSNLHVVMEEDAESLEEVVVMGYGVQKKKLVTGATIQVDGEKLAALNTTSPLAALQSSTPGMQITQTTGQPGDGYKVVIRGMGTIGSYEPLYVIDGIAGGDINNLNPADIESIDVLKDAASCAIYGNRGANGVVLVTTKQGKAGKTQVTYDGTYGWQNSPRMPELLTAKEYMNVQDMVNVNMGKSAVDWQNVLNSDLYNSIMDGTYTGTNWLNEIYNANAPQQNHSVNIVGGDDMSKFSYGLSYTGQEGIFGYPCQSDYNRTTARVNTERVIWKKDDLNILTFGENLTYTYSTKEGIGTGSHYWNDIYTALSANPIPAAKDADGNYNMYDYLSQTGLWTLDSYVTNPAASLVYSSRGNNHSQNHALNMSAYMLVQPIKGLTWKSQFNYVMSAGTYRDYSMIYHFTDKDTGGSTDIVSQSGWAGWSWSWENTVNYKFTFGQHNFDALVGNTLQHSGYGENVGGSNSTGVWPNDWSHAFIDNTTDVGTATATGSTWGDSGLVSFFGRVNYDFAEKYMLSLVLRHDGSSNFARGHRWGTFPSVSAGWVMTNEDWMANTSSWLDFLKLRAGWGQNGNCSIDNFMYLATVAIGQDDGGYSFGTGSGSHSTYQPGGYADKLANEDVSWETSEQIDLGFDARFAGGRLGMTFDWYNKTTKDWLVEAPVMGHFGANAPYINGGDVVNRGVELALTWNDQIGKDFTYSLGVNGAYNHNEVTSIANEEGIIHGPGNIVQGIAELYRAQVGYPIGYFWGYKTDGVFQNQQEIDDWVAAGKPLMKGSDTSAGDLKFVDLDNDGDLDDDDKTMLGDPNPDFTMGANITLGYKGFDFAISGYGAFGQQVFRAWRRYSDSQWNNYTTEVYDYWHGEGTSNTLPKLTAGTDPNFMNNSDIFIEDADYFKIQNITLGYDFARLWKNKYFDKFRFYAQLQNFFCFTGYKGLDPEVGASGDDDYPWAKGIDLGFYPSPKTFLVGVNVSFAAPSKATAPVVAHPAFDAEPEIRYVDKIVEKEVVKEVPATRTIDDALYFIINTATLQPDEAFKLGKIAQVLKENPEAKISIDGYADSATGTPAINDKLSQARAQVVADKLIADGIAPSRITTAAAIDKDVTASPEENRVAICIVK